ncbi:hypothetical protein BC941DRAFT_466991 [Chlamydoabsidia padenii]|nr:hypothetical protein BC941DRAFT_466991 [Chlamydoabsidia padenii]
MTSPHRKNSIFNMMSFSPTLNMLASSPSSFATPSPFALRHRDSYVHQRELESQFCQDLVCCNQPIADLHELLQHYEEQHVEVHSTDEANQSKGLDDEDEDEEMEEDQDDTNGNLPILLSSQDMSALEHEGGFGNTTLVGAIGNSNNGGVMGMDYHFGAPGLIHPDADKPYRCDVPGCDKAYKNPNGLKYHRMHGHCESTDSDNEADALQKPYQCSVMGCRKRYKNMNGLKYHIEHSHIKKMQTALPPWMASPWQQQTQTDPLQHTPYHLLHPHSQQQQSSIQQQHQQQQTEPIQRPSQLLQLSHQQQQQSLPHPQSHHPQTFL